MGPMRKRVLTWWPPQTPSLQDWIKIDFVLYGEVNEVCGESATRATTAGVATPSLLSSHPPQNRGKNVR